MTRELFDVVAGLQLCGLLIALSPISPIKLYKYYFAPCKGIRIPESRIFLLVESGILGFGIRNLALRIRNPTKDWNPESNLLKIHSRLN